jgi:hypothetical protein
LIYIMSIDILVIKRNDEPTSRCVPGRGLGRDGNRG